MGRRLGFFRKHKNSNQELIKLFERIQKIRLKSSDRDCENKIFVQKLTNLEKEASRKVLELLKRKEIKTADGFYRAAFIFHHGKSYKSYLIATALAAISYHLGDPWGEKSIRCCS